MSIKDSDIKGWFERDCRADVLDPTAAMPVEECQFRVNVAFDV